MKVTKLIAVIITVVFLNGCSNQNMGTLAGAASGTVIGASVSVLGAGIGLGVGALAGVAVGSAIDICTKNHNSNSVTNCSQ